MCYEIKNNLLEILKTLVSINTSIDISTMDAVNFIQQIFNDNNLSSFVIPYNNDKDRACFIGSTGNIHEPGLLLSGHLDTYGVSTQLKNWKTNPFKLTIHHDMLIGRGVVDMKGAIASFLSVIDKLKYIKTPVHIVLTHDEEGRFRGIKQLVDNNFYGLISPKQYGCIVMEPTSFKTVIGHQGYERQIIKFYNKEKGEEVKVFPKQFIEIIKNIYRNTKIYKSKQFAGKEMTLNFNYENAAKTQLEYQIKYSSENAKVANDFIKRIKMAANKYGYENNLLAIFKQKNKVLPFEKTEDVQFYKIVRDITSGEELIDDFGTEAGFFQNYGITNTIILGPGNYARAHHSNEDTTLEDLSNYSNFLIDITKDIDRYYNQSNRNLQIFYKSKGINVK